MSITVLIFFKYQQLLIKRMLRFCNLVLHGTRTANLVSFIFTLNIYRVVVQPFVSRQLLSFKTLSSFN